MVEIDPKKGVVVGARYVPSPNYNERPDGVNIDLIVVHGISLPPGKFGGQWIDDFFTNTLDPTQHPYFATIVSKKVSAHCLIRREGEIVQYVPFHYRAWHAGESVYQGREECNDFSIGIELEGEDTVPYTSTQYQVLTNLVQALQQHYPAITRDRVVGHCHVAPQRKTDPGEAFDWPLLANLLEKPRVLV